MHFCHFCIWKIKAKTFFDLTEKKNSVRGQIQQLVGLQINDLIKSDQQFLNSGTLYFWHVMSRAQFTGIYVLKKDR